MEFSRTFKDALGREWTVEISVATLRRLAEAPLSFTLDQIIPKAVKKGSEQAVVASYQAFLDDDLRFADVLFAILRPAADKLGMSQQEFEQGLSGEANQRAILAFHAAFTDSSPGPRKILLKGLQAAMTKQVRYQELAHQRIDEETASFDDAKMGALLDSQIQRAKDAHGDATLLEDEADPSLKPAIDSPATSASIPTP